MKRIAIFVLSAITTFMILYSTTYAQSVKVVKKGESVPFDGVLFTKEMEKSIRMDIQLYEKKVTTLTKLNELNEKENDILTKRVVVYQNKARELADREVRQERDTFWRNALFFVSGALLTGVIGYGVVQAYR